jgi:hypothetical protein
MQIKTINIIFLSTMWLLAVTLTNCAGESSKKGIVQEGDKATEDTAAVDPNAGGTSDSTGETDPASDPALEDIYADDPTISNTGENLDITNPDAVVPNSAVSSTDVTNPVLGITSLASIFSLAAGGAAVGGINPATILSATGAAGTTTSGLAGTSAANILPALMPLFQKIIQQGGIQ